MITSDGLTVLVYVFTVPSVWLATLALQLLSRRDSAGPVLRHAFIAALALALIVSIFALVFANNDLEIPVLTNEQTRFVTRSAILVIGAIPPVTWFVLVWRGR